MAIVSDEKLIAGYLKGDEKSLEILIKRWLKPIYSFVFRYLGNSQEAEDITQEVFIKVWRNLKRFDPRRIPTNRDLRGRRNKKFKTWLFTIAKNASIDRLRKKKVVSFPEVDYLADPALSVREIFEKREMAIMLNLAMEKLSSKYRQILSLRYKENFAFQEIADFLGKPLNTVKSRHRRAIIKLKKDLTPLSAGLTPLKAGLTPTLRRPTLILMAPTNPIRKDGLF